MAKKTPKVISTFNLSGGVGKSTLTKELGYEIAQRDKKVLLIDMDPQGSLTAFLGMDTPRDEPTIYDAIMGEENPILPAVHERFDWGFDLAPATLKLAKAEMELAIADMKEYRLKTFIDQHQAEYDFILIDCPPSMGMLSYISLVASTHVLVPIQTEFKCQKGTNLVLDMIRRVYKVRQAQGIKPPLKIAGFVPTLYQNNNHHNQVLSNIQELAQLAPILPTLESTIAMANSTNLQMPMRETLKRFEDIHLRVQDAIDAITQHLIDL